MDGQGKMVNRNTFLRASVRWKTICKDVPLRILSKARQHKIQRNTKSVGQHGSCSHSTRRAEEVKQKKEEDDEEEDLGVYGVYRACLHVSPGFWSFLGLGAWDSFVSGPRKP